MTLITSFLLVIALVSVKSSSVRAFSGVGTGSCDDPYVISTPEELFSMATDLSACYILNQDIDMSKEEWIPIGTYYDPFVGVLDGNGFSILNLSANTVWSPNDKTYLMAMFGEISGSAQIYI